MKTQFLAVNDAVTRVGDTYFLKGCKLGGGVL